MKLQLGDLLLRHWCVLAVGALAMNSRALSWISAFVTKKEKSRDSHVCVCVCVCGYVNTEIEVQGSSRSL